MAQHSPLQMQGKLEWINENCGRNDIFNMKRWWERLSLVTWLIMKPLRFFPPNKAFWFRGSYAYVGVELGQESFIQPAPGSSWTAMLALLAIDMMFDDFFNAHAYSSYCIISIFQRRKRENTSWFHLKWKTETFQSFSSFNRIYSYSDSVTFVVAFPQLSSNGSSCPGSLRCLCGTIHLRGVLVLARLCGW